MNKRRRFEPHGKKIILLIAILFILPMMGMEQTVCGQEKCAKDLDEAEQKYYGGKFDDAITQASRCLDEGGLGEPERLRAYKLIGLAYIAKDYLEQAKSAVANLLALVPSYEPDPNQDPPQFTNMVNELKQALARQQKQEEPPPVQPPAIQPEKKSGSKKWLWFGGGAAAITAALIVAVSGNDSPPPASALLPEPPTPPSQ
jgi:hypothetical protein